jgi:DNA-directed RNA polymerase subunit RPC12/RpoP
MNKCPKCGHSWEGRWEVGAKATVCIRCGHEFEAAWKGRGKKEKEEEE